jgi:hypothetical protein
MNRLRVLVDESGNILAAFPALQAQSNAPSRVAMSPSEGQTICEVEIPGATSGTSITDVTLDDYYVSHEKDKPRLVKRPSGETTS